MKHFIYSVHTNGGSRWSKGYIEFYMTDKVSPSVESPVMSVVVLHIGDTEEVMVGDVYRPSKEVPVRILRATYSSEDGYELSGQRAYLFNIIRNDIPELIKNCCDDIDVVLSGRKYIDVKDPMNTNWNSRVDGDDE